MKEHVIAFVGQVVPDTQEFNVPGFTRAGNLAQIGFVDGMQNAGLNLDVVLSSQPVAYFPKYRKIFKRACAVEILTGVTIKLVPLVNIFLLRDALRALYIYAYLFCWSVRHHRKERVILTYNLGVPPILPLLLLSRITGAKIVSILYDVAWPEGLKYGVIKTLVYRILTKSADSCIPKLDGRIVITDSIAKHYAPNGHSLRVDGGVTELVVRRLFPLVPAQSGEALTLLFAGGLDEWNHIPLILDMMRLDPDPKLKLWLAGNGALVNDVNEAAKNDKRIAYLGVLNHDQLFEYYQKADVLLNLRNTKDPAMQYAFPSKLLEILAVGKPVITTSIAHTNVEYGPYCFVLLDETPRGLMEMVRKIGDVSLEERVTIGKRAREFMLQEHTWKKQGMRIKEYLEKEVLGKNIQYPTRNDQCPSMEKF
jgi:glycosyltransferase involved in cell wall biosynthesis